MRKKYSTCEKCQTEWSEVFEYNDRWLCDSNGCLSEEIERDSEKHIRDEDSLDEYRQLCNGTNNIPASVYPQ